MRRPGRRAPRWRQLENHGGGSWFGSWDELGNDFGPKLARDMPPQVPSASREFSLRHRRAGALASIYGKALKEKAEAVAAAGAAGGERMTLRIYGIARTRAFRALWIAKELGLAYEHVPMEIGPAGARR